VVEWQEMNSTEERAVKRQRRKKTKVQIDQQVGKHLNQTSKHCASGKELEEPEGI